MPKRNLRRDGQATPAAIMAAYLEARDDELLDALATSAALVARADGWVQPVESGQLVDFLDRNAFLSILTRDEILEAFGRCVRELKEPDGPAAALGRLKRYAGNPLACVLIEVGEEIAAADCRLDRREERVLHFMRAALRVPGAPLAPGHGGGAPA